MNTLEQLYFNLRNHKTNIYMQNTLDPSIFSNLSLTFSWNVPLQSAMSITPNSST